MDSDGEFEEPSDETVVGTSENFQLNHCCICVEKYNQTSRAPVSMPCGHTFCRRCVTRMTNMLTFRCGICRTVSLLGWNGTANNLTMIQLLEHAKLLDSDDTAEATMTEAPPTSPTNPAEAFQDLDQQKVLDYAQSYMQLVSSYIKSQVPGGNQASSFIDKAVAAVKSACTSLFAEVSSSAELSRSNSESSGLDESENEDRFEVESENGDVDFRDSTDDLVAMLHNDLSVHWDF
uniref:RING-type domain-containing protein n=1 Tax=Panagrellus redivivus TaxID=6233 RepID=A0A7E4VQ63_PANRE